MKHAFEFTESDGDQRVEVCRRGVGVSGKVTLFFFFLVDWVGIQSGRVVDWIPLAPLSFTAFHSHARRQSCSAILRELAASTHAQNPREKGKNWREEEKKENSRGIKGMRGCLLCPLPPSLTPGLSRTSRFLPCNCSLMADLQSGLAVLSEAARLRLQSCLVVLFV